MFAIIAVLLFTMDAPNDFTRHMQRGVEETRQGQYANAMVDLQAAMKLKPEAPEAYFRLGLLLGQMTDFHDAESAFRRAIELSPSFAEAHFNLGLTQIANPESESKLDWPGAIASFRNALRCRPNFAEAANYLGVGLMATGDLEGAITELEQAVRLNPALAEAHFNLGLALEKRGLATKAESEYQLAVAARHERYPEASTALGRLLFHTHELREAEAELRTALRSNPDLSDAHYALAQLEQAEKKTATAQLEFEIVRQLGRRKTDAIRSSRVTNEGLQAAAKGDMTLALQLERQAVQLKPDFGVPHYNLALILADAEDWEGAAHELVKAASLMPGNAAPWFDLGRVLRRKEDLRGSLAALAWATQMAPSNSRIHAELSAVRLEAKADEPAVAEPPLGPTRDSASAHLAFARELTASGDHLGAVGECLRALALEPSNEQARRLLAEAYRQIKRADDAELEKSKLDLLASP